VLDFDELAVTSVGVFEAVPSQQDAELVLLRSWGELIFQNRAGKASVMTSRSATWYDDNVI
jgi:hypothetical protein